MAETAPRLAPLRPAEWSDEQREILKPMMAGKGLGRGVINVFATLVRHPKFFKRWSVFATHVLFKSTLGARERELLILRIAWLTGSAYEWGQHASIGRDAGLNDIEIEAIKDGAGAETWDTLDAALLKAVDELKSDDAISDPTWQILSSHYSEQQLIDAIFTVGQYNMLAMALNTLRVPLDPGWEKY